MPPSSKRTHKTTSSRSGKRKKSRKKSRPAKSQRKRQNLINKIRWMIVIVLGMGVLIGIGYCLGSCRTDKEAKYAVSKESVSKARVKSVIKTPSPFTKKSKTGKTDIQLSVEKRKEDIFASVKLSHRKELPKLAIIIDDVHTMAQLHAITSLPFPVTPSIFPPYTRAPHTPRLATHVVHYMVHLPMESGNAKYDRQSKTLKTAFSREQMEARIRELRRLFPRAHYINNHTGSRFTADTDAMKMLYAAMRKEGFAFVDSLTTGASKVKQIARSYGDAYVARDVFIDNRQQIGYIHRQLKKAVKIAKKKGYAIAIGHPHRVTFEALQKAKPLLKEVEVVYIDELFRR
jgi:polysaccharide deacetylase 2 family uncharacterized protein YibQ